MLYSVSYQPFIIITGSLLDWSDTFNKADLPHHPKRYHHSNITKCHCVICYWQPQPEFVMVTEREVYSMPSGPV